MIGRIGAQATVFSVPLLLGAGVCALGNPADSGAFVISLFALVVASLLGLGGIVAIVLEKRLLSSRPHPDFPSARRSSR